MFTFEKYGKTWKIEERNRYDGELSYTAYYSYTKRKFYFFGPEIDEWQPIGFPENSLRKALAGIEQYKSSVYRIVTEDEIKMAQID